MTEPASIRYNNPGAIWGGNALTKKWGETHHVALHDGKHQGNQMAVFPDKIHGAAAQFDLWNTSPHYHNRELSTAIRTWSGGNSSAQYVAFLVKYAPGLTPNTQITSEMLASPLGLAMMRAQAHMEAGKPYPMTDAEWLEAQGLVFKKPEAAPPAPVAEAAPANPILEVGSSGPSVDALQKLLGCRVTGEYGAGSETEYALKLFQVRNGLSPDGRCGPETWAKLKGATTS